jgi:hypothetical protein
METAEASHSGTGANEELPSPGFSGIALRVPEPARIYHGQWGSVRRKDT